MNWYNVFYWFVVADGAKGFFDTASDVCLWFSIGSFITYWIMFVAIHDVSDGSDGVDDTDRYWLSAIRRTFMWFFILCMVFWLGYVFTPTKKDFLLIVAGGAVGNFLTSDSSAKQIPSDITSYLHLSLKDEIQELREGAKKQIREGLDSRSGEQKLRDTLESMTKDQIIEYFKNKK